MANDDATWRKAATQDRKQQDHDEGSEIPGDTEAPDIVGRTGEEMPEVAHDSGAARTYDSNTHLTKEETPELPGIDAQDPSRMPRAEDDHLTMARSPEFHDRPGSGRLIADRHRVFEGARDEAEGQLGPDELPDPDEVIMNQEAKHHH